MVRIPRDFNRRRPTAAVISDRVRGEVSRSGQMAAAAFQEIGRGEAIKGDTFRGVLSGINNQIQGFIKQQNERITADYLTNQSLQFQKESMEFYNQAQQNMNPYGEGFADGIGAWHQTRMQQIIDQAPTPEAALAMQQRLGRYSISQMQRAFRDQNKASHDQTILNYQTTANELANQVLQSPGDYKTFAGQLGEALQGAQIDATTRMELQRNGLSQMHKNYVLGIANQQGSLAALQELGSKDTAALLDNGTVISLSNRLANQYKRELKELQDELQKRFLQEQYLSGKPLDPKNKQDRKAADFAYGQFLDGLGQDLRPEHVIGFLEERPSILPDRLKRAIETNIKAGDLQSAALYANIVGQMADRAKDDPRMFELIEQLDKSTFAKAKILYNKLASGAPLEAAVEQARASTGKAFTFDQQTIDDVIKGLNLANNPDVEDFIDDRYSKMFGLIGPDNSRIAKRAFIQEVEENIRLNPEALADPEIAIEQAKVTIGRTYEVSNVTGEPKLMKDAPELLHKGRGKDLKQNFRDFLNEFSEFKGMGGTVDAIPLGKQLTLDDLDEVQKRRGLRPELEHNQIVVDKEIVDVQIASDHLTRQGQGWQVFYMKQDSRGQLQQHFIYDKNGLPVRWNPELGPTRDQIALERRWQNLTGQAAVQTDADMAIIEDAAGKIVTNLRENGADESDELTTQKTFKSIFEKIGDIVNNIGNEFKWHQ